MSEQKKRKSGASSGRGDKDDRAANDSTASERRIEDGIDYTLEGSSPPKHDEESTDRGYDEAARSGQSMYGVPEGEGGVFGTTGGGTFAGGGQVIERPGVYDRSGEPSRDESPRDRHSAQREHDHFDSVNMDEGRKPED